MVNVFIHGNMRTGAKDNKFISGAVLPGRAETESDFAMVLMKGDPLNNSIIVESGEYSF